MPKKVGGKKGPAKKAKAKKSPEELKREKIQRDHVRLVRTLLKGAGFSQTQNISDKEFTYQGTTSDFDDVFVWKNVIVLIEYTITPSEKLSEHLKKKKVLYDKIVADPGAFVTFLRAKFPTFNSALDPLYQPHHFRVVVVYSPRYPISSKLKAEVPDIKYLEYNVIKYFQVVTGTVRLSSRYEWLDFLGLEWFDVGDAVIGAKLAQSTPYPGSILPDSHSNFGAGFKVVSFYVNPEGILQRGYVLRRQGWRSGATVYQRMISRKKIEAVRRYLLDQTRVFINNIIVTLPDDTKLLDPDGNTINTAIIKDTQPGVIQLPNTHNSVGIIDGQHRVFSYYEGGAKDEVIGGLRKLQNLLVTGVMFPPGMPDEEKLKFEAKLFLEINSNQTNAKSDLKQDLAIILQPFAPESIAKRVVNRMNDGSGPLADQFAVYFFDKDKVKTTSIVSYGIRPLVSLSGEDSLFKLWKHPDKAELLKGADHTLLSEYVDFCVTSIQALFVAARKSLPGRWTADRRVPKRFLTTTNINGLLGYLRRVVRSGSLLDQAGYEAKLKGLDGFDFGAFKSSQYNKMGEALFKQFP